MTSTTDKRVVIVGAGLVGLLMANLLAKQGFNLTIVDKAKPDVGSDDSIGLRVSAINRTTRQLFEELGLWQKLQDLRMGHYERMVVWDENSSAYIEMDAAEVGQINLGYIIENHLMVKVLYDGLQAYPQEQVQFIIDMPLSLQQAEPVWQLNFASGQCIYADLIIGADGAKSWLRSAVHIETELRDFQQEALVCTVRTDKSHNHTAYQRFLATGPLAFLPLHDPNLCSIVWSTAKKRAEELALLPDSQFNEMLEQAFEHRLGKLNVIGLRAHYPLFQQHAKHYVKPGIALIGDAAHSIHPLAGQGVNLGFLDAKVLAELLTETAHKGRHVGSLQTLLRYQRARKHYNAALMWSMYGFNALFSNQHKVLSQLRQTGINFVDGKSWLKRFFINQAMGNQCE